MDISLITDYLYVGSQPTVEQAEAIGALGIQLIISMRVESQPHKNFSRPPLRMLWLRTFDIFFLPIPLAALEQGVRTALPIIANGGRVLTHCHRGKHRSVAMAAAILIAMGHSAEQAMHLLREKRAIARPQTWYIRRQIQLFETYWQKVGCPPPASPLPAAAENSRNE